MKHPFTTTVILITLFVAAQVIGISLLTLNIGGIQTDSGERIVVHDSTIVGERPQVSGAGGLLFIAIGVLFGTIAVLLLIRFSAFRLWKAWFLLAVFLALSVAFGVLMPPLIAYLLAGILALWKIFRPNPIVHNFTEIFLYAGIAILISPIFDVWWAIILLLLISVYDIIAVWHSKHMVTMAKAQAERNLFAGLHIPSNSKPEEKNTFGASTKTPAKTGKTNTAPDKKNTKMAKNSHAILGGGDIAFPLIFSGAVMTWLIEEQGLSIAQALTGSLTVTVCTTIALTILFWKAQKEKFYPAMPFLSLGCFVGFGILLILF